MNPTAIFVFQSTTVTIVTSESNLSMCAYPSDTPTCTLNSFSTTVNVTPGLYKILSSQPVAIRVTGGGSDSDIAVQTVDPNNKSQFPQPPPVPAAGAAANVAMSTLAGFFPQSRSLSRSIG